MAITKFLDQVGEDLKDEADRYHVPAQVGRFASLFVVALAAQALGGRPVVGWADVWSLLAGAAGVAYGQWRRTMPVPAALKVVEDAKAAAEQAPPTAPRG